MNARFAIAVCAGLVAVQAAAVLGVLWPDIPVDDAWIAFRYARNLVEGHGLVFNPGEPVEGYSSLAWTVLCAVALGTGLDVATFARIAGLAFGVGTMLLVARRSLVAAAWLSIHLPALYHFSNGLETALVAFLLTAFVLREREDAAGRALAMGLAALLAISRPEGVLVVVLWSLLRGVSQPSSGTPPPSGVGSGLAGEAAVALAGVTAWGAQTAVRWTVYGDWIANSARAKLLPAGFALPHGLRDLADFLWTGGAFGAIAALVLAGATFDAWKARGRDRRLPISRQNARRAMLVLTALVLARGGGDSFPMWRFLVPLAPLLLLEAALGLRALASAIGSGRTRSVATAVATAGIAIALLVPAPGYLEAARREGQWMRHWSEVGRALHERAPADASLAVSPAGALPYHARLETIDMLGLNEATIARSEPDLRFFYPGHHRQDGAHVHDRSPDLIVLGNAPRVGGLVPEFPWRAVRIYEREVVLDPRFEQSYSLVHLPLPSGGYALVFAHARVLSRLALGDTSSPGPPARVQDPGP